VPSPVHPRSKNSGYACYGEHLWSTGCMTLQNVWLVIKNQLHYFSNMKGTALQYGAVDTYTEPPRTSYLPLNRQHLRCVDCLQNMGIYHKCSALYSVLWLCSHHCEQFLHVNCGLLVWFFVFFFLLTRLS